MTSTSAGSSVLNIVVPMAGRGSRFANAGYPLPKPLIPVHGVAMIQLVIANVRPRTPHRFVFLCLEEHIQQHDVAGRLRTWAPGSEIVVVDRVTEGAACTVLLARKHIDNGEPLMIVNSDQWVDIDINDYLSAFERSRHDGFIMTMRAADPKWSYVRLDSRGNVSEVVEKQVVSNEATVGIYNFRRGSGFVAAAEEMIAADKRVNGEFYVAPAYNEMLRKGLTVGYYNIGEVGAGMYGLGTPEDLTLFASLPLSKRIATAPR